MDASYTDYSNKQLEVAWAIEYVQSAQELEAEVVL